MKSYFFMYFIIIKDIVKNINTYTITCLKPFIKKELDVPSNEDVKYIKKGELL